MESYQRYEELVADALREAGIQAREESGPRDHAVDIRAVLPDGRPLYIEVKAAPEGRPDRLIPLFAKAVLQIKAHSAKLNKGADLLAVVGAPVISAKAADAVIKFAREYAPGVGVGVVDLDGLRLFHGHNLEALNASRSSPRRKLRAAPASNLFSDLNQWLLKVLLAKHLNRPELLHSPIANYKNASELAEAAKVSIMSAFRLVEALRHEGFLHESSDGLELVRARELLAQWQAIYQRPARELPVRWLLPNDSPAQLSNAVKAYGERSCVGLFAAAHAHGFRHVTGVPIHLYVDSFDQSGLDRMGVIPVRPGEAPDLILRVPAAKESVFRGMAMVGRGFRASDILQVWLDVASYPARGQEQADIVYRKVIEPMLART